MSWLREIFDLLLYEIDQQEARKEKDAAKRKIYFRRSFVIVAAILISLLAAGTAMASWNRWLALEETSTDIALKWEKRSTHMKSEEISEWHYLYLPTHLPQGYVELNRIIQFNEVTITYGPYGANTDEIITYLQFKELDYLSVDNEDAEVSEVSIGENKGTLIQKENEKVLFWNNEDSAFCLSAQIPISDLIYFAEHLKRTNLA